MKFYTQFHRRKFVPTEPGDPIKVTYAGRYDDCGRVVLMETGKINLQDEIQSHADSVDIHTLLKRFTNGDASALSSRQAIFADVTEMPKTYAEMLNKMIDMEQAFNHLDPEIKEKFGNSFQRFLAESNTESFAEKLGLVEKAATVSLDQQDPAVDTEVK